MVSDSSLQRTRAGLGASLGLVLSLLAMLGTSMHVLLVEHELCDEHGALVEADADHERGQGADTQDAHDDDTHCPLAVACAAPLSAPPAVALRAPLAEAVDAVSAPLVGVRAVGGLWRTAPKTSPPRA